jgi:hypothetical protein
MVYLQVFPVLIMSLMGQEGRLSSGAGCAIPAGHSVVLSGTEGLALAKQCSRRGVDGVTGIWNPSDVEISELENRLCDYLKEMQPQIFKDISTSYFQFVGFMSKGRRIIYVNSFYEWVTINPKTGSRKEWRTRGIRFCDGGRWFWGVEYDPTTKVFFNQAFNGPS